MICERCGGLSVTEYTPNNTNAQPWEVERDKFQQRCLNCGDISSRLIRANRRKGVQEVEEAACLQSA